MYTLELGLWERLQLNICLPRDAPWAEMEQLVRISKAVGLTNDEEVSIDFNVVRVQTAQGTIEGKTWDNDKLTKMENLQTIKLKAADFLRLKKDADTRPNWPRGDRSLALKTKMEAAQEK